MISGSRYPDAVPVSDNPADTWRPLRLLNLYRIVLAGLLVVLTDFGVAPSYFGQHQPRLFLGTAVVYLAFGIASSFAIRWRRPPFGLQVFAQVMVDIIAITVMMHASGGVRSGFGMLLVVAIAGGSILTVGRTAGLFAALAALAVLAQEVYAWAYQVYPDTGYSQSGMLGATFFATAFLAHVLAERVRRSEALARQRGLDLANLSVLNDHIIQRMQSGILAVDSEDRVRLMNGSARRLLGIAVEGIRGPLGVVSPELSRLLTKWRGDPSSSSHLFKPAGTGADVIASFAALEQPTAPGALVFLEDSSAMTDRAQRLKLAALGRLTASIAHEIRNPLGAISHAGQLLAESPEIAEPDQRLTGIITDQSQRVNAIIENVLQLSRRKPPDPEGFPLADWLRAFAQDFARDKALDPKDIRVLVANEDVRVRIDPVQLHQVLTNLCENGLRYGQERPRLTLQTGVVEDADRTLLDVCDSGPGISRDAAEHLFEPFFTTEKQGTGLGLYISRELCEINHASLSHLGCMENGHCFRITFAHPRRQGTAMP